MSDFDFDIEKKSKGIFQFIKKNFIFQIIGIVICASIYTVVANVFKFKDKKFKKDVKKFKNFGDSLYFSLVNHYTVGFGDISPESTIFRIIVCLQIVIAYILMNA